MRDTLAQIYKGNAENGEEKAEKYVKKYDEHLFKAKTATMEKLTGKDLKQTAMDTGDSAAGLDQWAPGDMKMISDAALDALAEMLNMVEEGAEWPEQLRVARAAFLSKNPEERLDPLEHRVLLMLPSTYRLWSKTRLRHLQPWVAAWAEPEMFAGVEGKGAEDAAYSSALLVEWCKMTGTGFTGGSADIYKCFDQILRPLVKQVLVEAGMPSRIIDTYIKYLENLKVYNIVAGGLGEPYGRPTSIPQGDPMSMMIVAILLRPWIPRG